MLALAFAAVPLYRVFCQVTGFGGTTMKVEAAPGAVAVIVVRFDAVFPRRCRGSSSRASDGADPSGARAQDLLRLRPTTPRGKTTGQAIFNVTPEAGGQYFSKIECFCFTEQTLKPAEDVRMPVIPRRPKLRDYLAPDTSNEMTLSYTFIRWKIRKAAARAGKRLQGTRVTGIDEERTIITSFRLTSGR